MSRRIQFVSLLLLLGLLSVAAQSAFAQADPPLNFGNNYFVTGDYVVAGAYGLNVINGSGMATGTINIPDKNNIGLTGTNQVPAGAQIVKALLYWQTVEKVGQAGSGQNGTFRPKYPGGPQTPYPMTGVNVSGANTVSWSSGGCTGSSTGKFLTTYRADVTDFLPQDKDGNIIVDGLVNGVQYGTYEVRLPSSGNNTPLTLGATLVVIFRVLSPDYPLNSIVIYDGDFAPGGALLTMTQTVQGFYDAATDLHAHPNAISRLTHIVSNGKSNKNQTVKLNGQTLPFLYGGLSAFPGHYVNWDTVTWTFDDPKNPMLAGFPNPINEHDASVMTEVDPASSNQGCVAWGAVIVSTTVNSISNDGLLDVWKQPTKYPNPLRPGYCDASVNEGVCTQGDANWVDLPGAVLGQKDVFVQLDYMCSKVNPDGTCDTNPASVTSFSIASSVITVTCSNSFSVGDNVLLQIQNPSVGYLTGVYLTVSTASAIQFTATFTHADVPSTAVTMGTANHYSFDPRLTFDTSVMPSKSAVDKVVDAYLAQGIHLHVNPLTPKPMQPVHAIQEQTCMDNSNNPICANVAANGLTAFPNQPGVVAWKGDVLFFKNQLLDPDEPGILTDCTGAAPEGNCITRFQPAQKDSWHYALWAHTLGLPNWTLVGGSLVSAAQTGNTVVFTTSMANGLVVDSSKPNGRVTIAYSITNPKLNGTYLVTGINVKGNPNSFMIQVPNSAAANFTYTAITDPNFGVVSGDALESGTISGFSDIGGSDSLITLGSWGANGLKWQLKAGTFMHELGHSNGLTHGGFYFDKLTANNKDYTPTVEGNCKSNLQSVMTYEGQLLLLRTGPVDPHTHQPIRTVDYSGQYLNTIDEGISKSAPFFTSPPLTYPYTFWYKPWLGVGTLAKEHCDGTPRSDNEKMFQFEGKVETFAWSANQDLNFDGMIETISNSPPPFGLRGHNDWADIVINGVTIAPGVNLQQVSAAGSMSSSGGHGFGGGSGGHGFGGGSGGHGFGGGSGAGELNVETANAQTFPPQNLTASEAVSPRTITLNWAEPGFGVIGAYRIYRALNGVNPPFPTIVATVPGSQLTFQDTVTCNTTGYQYYVTAVLAGTFVGALPGPPPDGQESPNSNIVSTIPPDLIDPLTGCYIVTGFSSPANAIHGTIVPITWTLTDDFYPTNGPVNNLAANTLVAIGPGGTRTTLVSNGTPTTQNAATFMVSAGQFTFNWDTDPFLAGSYSFELDLDSTQSVTTASALQIAIDVNDQDTPQVSPLPLPPGVVGQAYGDTLTEHGGTPPFMWTFTRSLPTGISQQSPFSPTLTGTTCVAGAYNFTAMVTDAKSNSGTQALTLQINMANTTTGVASNANPSVFQQMVTFKVTVAPNSPCTPTGTVNLFDNGTQIATQSLTSVNGGIATFPPTSALSVGVHNITASYLGDANFNGSSSAILVQTVNPAQTTTTINSVSSPAIVGQAVTVSYTLAVLPPGAGTPIKPTGTVMVTSSDGSSCPAVPVVLGPGVCVLSPIPTKAGPWAVTVTYSSADGNFVGSGANSPYIVYIYVSDAAPPPFTAVTTLPNGVVGSPYSNTIYESGGVTGGASPFVWALATGSNPLPAGLSLALAPDGVSGLISGTPTSAGTFTFTAMVTDSAGNTGTQNLTITVLAPAPAPYGLVSWYPFEGNANDLEKTNNGNVVGTPQFVPAEVDNGLKPGPQLSGSLITVPNSSTLALTQFSIGAWVRVDALDNVETMQIVWKGDSTAGDLTTPYSLSILGSANSSFSGTAAVVGTPGPGKVLVVLTDGSGAHELDLLSTNALSLGTFHYVAVTADGQKVNLYIDGVLDGNSPASESSLTGLPFTNTNPLQIGGVQGGPAPGNNFDGVIDELQIWNRVLTPGEISGIFNTVAEFQPVARPAGLVSWWPAEGSYADIISGNNGAPSGVVGFAPGEVGQAFSFSGGAAEIQVADNANLDVGQITIEAWVKPTTSGHGRPIVQKRSSANVGGYTFETTDTSDGPGPANGLQFAIWISGTQYLLQTPANALTINAWQHVAATYDGSTMNIYINGALLASQATPGGPIDTDSADPLVMGLNVVNASYDWNGFTDEVSLYNRALTSAEIQSIVNAGGAGKAKP